MYVVVGHDAGERLVVVTPSEREAKGLRTEWITLDHLEQVRVYRVAPSVAVYDGAPVTFAESRWGRRDWTHDYPPPVVGKPAGRLWAWASRQWREVGSEVVRRFRLA